MPTAITNVNILFGKGAEIQTDGAIIIDDEGLVAEIVRMADLPKSLAIAAYDGMGATAMPGLIDMHTHAMGGKAEEMSIGLTPATLTAQVLRGVQNTGRALSRGITTIRDAGAASASIFALKAAIDKGEIMGPRMILSGQALTMTGGHGWNSIAIEADGADELRKAARMQIKAGAECIKLIASSGASAPCGCLSGLQLNIREMMAAAQEAHRSGLHVMAHAIPAESVREAIEAGVDSIEHGIFLDQDIVAEMKRAGSYYCPTLAIFRRIAVNASPGLYPPFMVEKAKQCVDAHRVSFELARAAGIPILAGSDSGNWGWKLGDLADELVVMNQYGLPRADCIASATSTAAKFLNKEDSIGTLLPGKQADILLIDGNPLENLMALYKVKAVFKGGIQVH